VCAKMAIHIRPMPIPPNYVGYFKGLEALGIKLLVYFASHVTKHNNLQGILVLFSKMPLCHVYM